MWRREKSMPDGFSQSAPASVVTPAGDFATLLPVSATQIMPSAPTMDS
jgi:hypothetical protein